MASRRSSDCPTGRPGNGELGRAGAPDEKPRARNEGGRNLIGIRLTSESDSVTLKKHVFRFFFFAFRIFNFFACRYSALSGLFLRTVKNRS